MADAARSGGGALGPLGGPPIPVPRLATLAALVVVIVALAGWWIMAGRAGSAEDALRAKLDAMQIGAAPQDNLAGQVARVDATRTELERLRPLQAQLQEARTRADGLESAGRAQAASLSQERDAARASAQGLEASLTAERARAAELEASAAQFRAEAETMRQAQGDLPRLESELAASRTELEQARARIQEVEAGLGAERSRAAKLEADLAGARAETETVKQAQGTSAADAMRLEGELGGVRSQLATVQGEAERARARGQELDGERARTRAEAESLRQAQTAGAAEVVRLESELAGTRRQAGAVQGEAEQAKARVHELEMAAREAAASLEARANERDSALAEVGRTNEAIEAERRKAAELTAREQQVLAQVASLEGERERLLAQTAGVERERERLAGLAGGLERDLQARTAALEEQGQRLALLQAEASGLAAERDRLVPALSEAQEKLREVEQRCAALPQRTDAAPGAIRADFAGSYAGPGSPVLAQSDGSISGRVADELGRSLVPLAPQIAQALRQSEEEAASVARVVGSLKGADDVELVRGTRLLLPTELRFAAGEAALDGRGRGAIAPLAVRLKAATADLPADLAWRLRIEGHTDGVETAGDQLCKSAWDLSAARAGGIASLLVRDGVPADRLVIAGYAGTEPAVAGSTDDARARNRRVEMRFASR